VPTDVSFDFFRVLDVVDKGRVESRRREVRKGPQHGFLGMIETNAFNDGTHGDSRPSNPGLSPTDLCVMDDVARQGLHAVFSSRLACAAWLLLARGL
jgi:hypothetical protein